MSFPYVSKSIIIFSLLIAASLAHAGSPYGVYTATDKTATYTLQFTKDPANNNNPYFCLAIDNFPLIDPLSVTADHNNYSFNSTTCSGSFTYDATDNRIENFTTSLSTEQLTFTHTSQALTCQPPAPPAPPPAPSYTMHFSQKCENLDIRVQALPPSKDPVDLIVHLDQNIVSIPASIPAGTRLSIFTNCDRACRDPQSNSCTYCEGFVTQSATTSPNGVIQVINC